MNSDLKIWDYFFSWVVHFNGKFWFFHSNQNHNTRCSTVLNDTNCRHQFSSIAQSSPTLCIPMNWSTLGFPVHHQLPELAQTRVHWLGATIQLSYSLSFPLLPPSIFPSIRVFSSESVLHIRWPKYWSSASASVLPMNIQDWFPLGWTGWISLGLLSLLQHHSSKASVLQRSALQSNSHIHTWLLEKSYPWLDGPLSAK